jgi:hypothetical protein
MSEQETEETNKQPPIPEAKDTARKISPFKVIRRGKDSVDNDEDVVFADFSPLVLPADVPDEEIILPKDAFAREPAPLTDLAPSSALTSSVTPALKAASSGDGKPSPSATSSQPSSLPKKSG